MSPQETFRQLKDFIETHAASRAALEWVAPETEIGVEIGEMISATLTNKGGQIQLREEKAKEPVLIVHVKPQVISTLVQADEAAAMGEILLKEYLAGRLRVERATTWSHLAAHGYGWITTIGLTKTTDLIRHLKG